MSNSTGNFHRISIITIIAVYLVILAGGIVRSTGSGMGCPDWPKCFGRYIPPTNVNQLPPDYKEKYKVHGYEAEFNVTKTWIEYINRLLGAITGILVLLVLLYSIPYLKTDRAIFWLSILTVFLVGFEAWLGKVVVASNLSPAIVTMHMGGSLLIVAALIYMIIRSRKDLQPEKYKTGKSKPSGFILILMLVTFLQILLGTQVREEIDIVAESLNFQNREKWMQDLGWTFNFHRLLGYLAVFLAILYFLEVKKRVEVRGILYKSGLWVAVLMLMEMVIGIALFIFDLPPFLQPFHLLIATIIFGIQFFALSVMVKNRVPQKA
ncbi:MAG: COX15/CtaA family protein [Cytophagaceae bacterium]